MNWPNKEIFLFCLIFTLALPQSLYAQSANSCSSLIRYQEHCRRIDVLDRCSREFTSLCCKCEESWNTEFDFCDYTLAVFPTPSVFPTPVATCSLPPGVPWRIRSRADPPDSGLVLPGNNSATAYVPGSWRFGRAGFGR